MNPYRISAAPIVRRSHDIVAYVLATILMTTAFIASATSCNSAQDTTAVKIIDAACLDVEVAASVIPPSAIQQAAEDISLVCTEVPVSAVVAFITDVFAKQADAGTPAPTEYRPSPNVMRAKAAARTKAFGDGK